jgi:hypothetical protein
LGSYLYLPFLPLFNFAATVALITLGAALLQVVGLEYGLALGYLAGNLGHDKLTSYIANKIK